MILEIVKEFGKLKVYIEGKLWRTLSPGPFSPILRGASSFEELQANLHLEEPKTALRVAVHLLAKQALTRAQLIDRLERRGFLPDIAKKTAARCVDEGWIDDTAWTKSYIAARLARGYGKKRIELELKQKGLTWPEDCRPVNSETLQRLIEKRYSDIQDSKERRRAVTSLLRRGFDLEEILSLLPS